VTRETARDAVLSSFRWSDGHADVWALFREATTFAAIVDELSLIAERSSCVKIAGVESRGFILGAATAARSGLGFVSIRKAGGLFPGVKLDVRGG